MSTSPTTTTPTTTTTTIRPRKVLVPKVWKRPHSTIYGKNVEFGSALYSDKIGELNSRKFNSELPWTMRNSANSPSTSGASYNQGPSLPQKTTTAHASDGEEFEFQDRSSPFYTDRWAGKTIRHFDSDLYSNASLFKSMIL